jgi:predicted dehydrogenase
MDFVHRHPDFESVGCVDSSEASIRAARELPGQDHGRFFTSVDEALTELSAEAALIASPSFLHVPHTVAALDAGLGVMVEKPLAGDLGSAVDVVEHARGVGLPLMVSMQYRFFRVERTLRRFVETGGIGSVCKAVCVDLRDLPSRYHGSWIQQVDEPHLTEIAVHHFDSFRYLFDREPISIFARSYNPAGSDYAGPAASEALIELHGGFPIQYSGTMVAPRHRYRLWVEGDEGDAWADRRRVWFRPKGRHLPRLVKPVPVPKGDEQRYPRAGTVALLDQFRDALTAGALPETRGSDNLWSLAMVEAAIRSSSEGRRVAVRDVLTDEMRRRAGIIGDPHAGRR